MYFVADDLDDILRGMGFRPSKEELKEILEEIDEDGSGEIEFEEFCQLCAKFLIEEPDEETMKHELKEAFRVYDKEANGFITTDTLREIISELDQRLTNHGQRGGRGTRLDVIVLPVELGRIPILVGNNPVA